MRSISITIAHAAAQVAGCCSGALRAITVGAENARSRVLAGPRDSGRHFVSKCSHCACSVSHERGPNARSYVKSPPPLPLSLISSPFLLCSLFRLSDRCVWFVFSARTPLTRVCREWLSASCNWNRTCKMLRTVRLWRASQLSVVLVCTCIGLFHHCSIGHDLAELSKFKSLSKSAENYLRPVFKRSSV